MTSPGALALAAVMAARTGGRLVGPTEPSGAMDVVVGDLDRVVDHRGWASFAVGPGGGERDAMQRSGWTTWFEGEVSTDVGSDRVTVASRHGDPATMAAIPAGRCVAIVAAYNEVDVLASVVEHMVAEGVEVYVIDNWSTDGTDELARSLVEEGVAVGTERFPAEEPAHGEWAALLQRKAEIAVQLGADWAIHSDADEVRTSPWPTLTLRDGLAVASATGANAIDFTVLDHPPVRDDFVPGDDVVAALPHYHFGNRPGHFRQVKAWKPNGHVVRMGGGHDIRVPGRRVFPFNFLLHHYPIRSAEHGRRKVFHDRRERWSPEEQARGWHRHYEDVTADTSFLHRCGELMTLAPDDLLRAHLGQVLARIGMHP